MTDLLRAYGQRIITSWAVGSSGDGQWNAQSEPPPPASSWYTSDTAEPTPSAQPPRDFSIGGGGGGGGGGDPAAILILVSLLVLAVATFFAAWKLSSVVFSTYSLIKYMCGLVFKTTIASVMFVLFVWWLANDEVKHELYDLSGAMNRAVLQGDMYGKLRLLLESFPNMTSAESSA